ncbi:MAG: GAF domain-containing protein [Desulfobacteraceae bacterium]|nr:MAG: GAF domain-containing protein [Desulfobacteraceae bacterium]
MPRQSRLDAAGALHHIICRGIERIRSRWGGSGNQGWGDMVPDERSHTNDRRAAHQFEDLISDFSARFVQLTSNKIDQEIERAMKRVLDFFSGDCCELIKILHGRRLGQVTHASYAQGVQCVYPNANLCKVYPWQYGRMIESNLPVVFSKLADLPPEAAQDRQAYATMGIRSLLSVPVCVAQRVAYVLTLQTIRDERVWPENYLQRLQLLAEIFVNALIRKEADQALRKGEEALEDSLGFERVLSELSARFVALGADQINNAIEDAQKTIVEALGLDRSVLYQLMEDEAVSTHSWTRPQWEKISRLNVLNVFPWAYQKLMSGDILAFSSLDELPADASTDIASCKMFGVTSSLGLPLRTGGRLFGALTFTSLTKEKKWPSDLVNRLRLVSEIFTNALARKSAEEQIHDKLREIQALKERLEKDNLYLRSEVELLHEHGEIVGEGKAVRKVLLKAEQVAPTDTTVLILGETGTGKELLAREIHAMSKRRDRPLVTVNCASLPPALIESELFGREKGAYTGALTRMTGRFETAEGSTLFLDEIGELPHEIQAKLLRIIENGTFERLGSTRTIRVDARIIAATNRDLAQEVKEGRFRKDLYYRLNVFPITIPPLRERIEDIPALVWAFVQQFEIKMGKRIEHIPQKSMDALSRYSWPGNIRELKNVIEHAMITSRINLYIAPPAFSAQDESEMGTLEDMERRCILRVLKRTGWRIAGKNGAAEILGIKRTTLYAMMKKLGIQRPEN